MEVEVLVFMQEHAVTTVVSGCTRDASRSPHAENVTLPAMLL